MTLQGLLRIAVVGAPPFARGSDVPGRDLEQQLVFAFPGCALFVEKPVSSGPEDECWRVAKVLKNSGALVGVGYILDTQCGFQLFLRRAAQQIFPYQHQHLCTWIFDVEILLLAKQLRMPVAEVPIAWHEVSESKLNVVMDSLQRHIPCVSTVSLDD